MLINFEYRTGLYDFMKETIYAGTIVKYVRDDEHSRDEIWVTDGEMVFLVHRKKGVCQLPLL